MTIEYAEVEEVTTTSKELKPRVTAFGYTKREGSPTKYKVRLKGEKIWRRVYVIQLSNTGSCFIKTKDKHLYVRDGDLM